LRFAALPVSHPEDIPLLPPPRHVGIIMDGNGRWAKARGLPRIEGHRRGVENVLAVLDAGADLGIEVLTLYAFSVENWQRPADEVAALMHLLEFFITEHTDRLIARETRLRVAGDISALPDGSRRAVETAMAKTTHFTKRTLCLALNYGSRTEVIEAAKSFARDVAAGKVSPDTLDWEKLSDRLYTAGLPDPDLIIRTSGETRLSNFLLLQAAYAEMYFTPVPWPEFGPERLKEAVDCFRRRERRFGKTGEQVKSQK
jgi:undecaprenyl diphosphate synthase